MPAAVDPRDELSAFLDDELSAEERAELEEAIASDPSLRAEHDELKDMVSDLRSLGQVEAPPNFLAGVMARIDAGEGVDDELFADSYEPPGDNLRVIEGGAGDPEPDVEDEPLPDNVVRFPWWVKGPALTAVAALLIIGIGYQVRGPMLGAPPAAESVAMRPAMDAAPMPTGVSDELDLGASFDMGGDAIAAAEEKPVAERLRMDGPAGDAVAVGGAGSGATLRTAPAPAPRRASGITEVKSAPPAGIVVGDFSPEPEPDVESDAVADAGLMPAEAAAGALSVAPAAESAPSDRTAMAAVAKLVTGEPQAILRIRDAAESNGWQIRFVSPADGPVVLSDSQTEQVVELVLPTGSEVQAQNVLESRGAFTFTSTPGAADSDRSRLRVTIIFQQ